MNLTHQCAYGTFVWKDEQGLIISQPRTILSCMARHLTLQPWLRKAIYPPFASLDGMSGATIVNKLLPFPTIMKYLDGSWALLEAKVMKWPNGFSRRTGKLCLGNPYDCLQLPKYIVQLKKRNKMCSMH